MSRSCKILVVEDNDGIREFLQSLFDDEGYEIAVVAGGEATRSILARERFDIAVIDVTLPGADDGFSLAKLAQSAGCGVILVTGDTRHFDRVAASGHRFLFKPFRIERLMQLVAELVALGADCSVAGRSVGQ
jgi:two-component system, NtrC family, nitrogen regulation response regulator NtrX